MDLRGIKALDIAYEVLSDLHRSPIIFNGGKLWRLRRLRLVLGKKEMLRPTEFLWKILFESNHFEDQEGDGTIMLRKLNCYDGRWMRLAEARNHGQEMPNSWALLSEISL